MPEAQYSVRIVLSAAVLLLGCVRQVPPPAVPEQVLPFLGQLPPTEEGFGRVVVDVVDGPSDIYFLEPGEVRFEVGTDPSVRASSVSSEHACVTPCVLDLTPGRHVLGFPTPGSLGRLEYDQVDVGLVPTVYRRSLGSRDEGGAGQILGIVGAAFGGMALIVGTALFPVGLATDDDGLALAGEVNLLVGLGLTTLGVIGLVMNPRIEQAGSSTQFPVPPTAQ